jgi:hypothetical protein
MVGLTMAVLIIRMFMAEISREKRPAFISMVTSVIPDDDAYYQSH